MEKDNAANAAGNAGDSGSVPRIDLSGVKRGPGRPRKDGQPAGSGNAPKSSSPRPLPQVDSADAEFLADAVITIWECGDELLHTQLLRRIREAMPDKVDDFIKLQNQVRLGGRDKDLARKALLRLAQKYQFLARFAPEILLLGLFAQYSVRQLRLVRAVELMVEEAKSRPQKVVGPVPASTDAKGG